MNVTVDTSIHRRLERVAWFGACGDASVPRLPFECQWVSDRAAALASLKSDVWMDARTEAQGDLTGYLAKHHYNAYGGHWNDMAKQSRALLEKTVAPMIGDALASRRLAQGLLPGVLLDLNRAILEASYRQRFPKVPAFFERLLLLYEAGRLPCGWNGSLDAWPTGRLIAH